jgi:hypothetical protein
MGIGGPLGGWVNDRYGWRMAFLGTCSRSPHFALANASPAVQLPLFLLSFVFTQTHLNYLTPGKARSPLAILSRIDYLGSLALLLSVGSTLFALSFRFNQDFAWSHRRVWGCSCAAIAGAAAFLAVEMKIAVEPVLAPEFLRMRVPVLVAVNSLLVPLCNFAVICESREAGGGDWRG